MQGRIAMWHALGEAVAPLRLSTVASNVFTDPEIATVGVTAADVDEGRVAAKVVMLPAGDQRPREDAGHPRRLREAALPPGLRHRHRRGGVRAPRERARAADLARRPMPDRNNPVFVRLARVGDVIWLDLGRPEWDAVKVTGDGWTIVASPEVRFRRSRGLLALPEPVRGTKTLREMVEALINVADARLPILLVGWFTAGPEAVSRTGHQWRTWRGQDDNGAIPPPPY